MQSYPKKYKSAILNIFLTYLFMVGTKGFALFHFSAASAIMTLIGILRSATDTFSVMNARLYDIKNIPRPDYFLKSLFKNTLLLSTDHRIVGKYHNLSILYFQDIYSNCILINIVFLYKHSHISTHYIAD